MADNAPLAEATTQTEAPTTTSAQEPQSIESLSASEQHEQLKAQLEKPDWTPEGAQPAEEAPAGEQPPAQTQTTETTTTEGTQQPGDGTTEETPGGDDKLPEGIHRPRLTDPTDQVIAALKKAHPELSWAECEARVTGKAVAKAEPAATQETVELDTPDSLAVFQKELEDIDQQLADKGANEGLWNADIADLMKRRGEVVADIKLEQRDALRRSEDMANSLASKQKDNARESMARYPSLKQEDSELRIEATRLRKLYAGTELLKAHDAPTQIAELAALNVAKALAAKNGTEVLAELAKLEAPKPAKAEATSPATTQQKATAVQPVKKIIPASGSAVTQSPSQTETEQTTLAAVAPDSKSEYQRLAEMFTKTN